MEVADKVLKVYEDSSGLAVVVIGGAASCTLLTLVVVPVMYELLHFKRLRKQRKASTAVTVEAAA